MGEIVQEYVAQAAETSQAASESGNLLGMLPMMIGIFAIWYFLVIRPQGKQRDKQKTMIDGLKKGDQVILHSGIFGKIFAIDEKALVIEIADKVRIKVLRSAVSSSANNWDKETETSAPKAVEKKS